MKRKNHIEVFYNGTRHSHFSGISPEAFEKAFL